MADLSITTDLTLKVVVLLVVLAAVVLQMVVAMNQHLLHPMVVRHNQVLTQEPQISSSMDTMAELEETLMLVVAVVVVLEA